MKETGGNPQAYNTNEGPEHDMIERAKAGSKEKVLALNACAAYVSTNVQGDMGTGGEDEGAGLYENISAFSNVMQVQ